ncbi:hypothetical protein E4K67_27300 [Desulfosporosinus fructosivorans]|uniref:Uncharacterized protein n=1 Tax=Desulfosporosinus fructosivorans TaxID=2018669 RepID=A0A4Z0QW09_9FIRM|nr:hypothetical protein E4K67_27300 [Desulfosporosinus fructosivorans]
MVTVSMVMAVVAVSRHKLTFIDGLIIVMVIALSMGSDMLLCKQFSLYYIVSVEYRGWYSFWSCLLVFPSLAITFLKFAPRSRYAVMAYIAFYSLALTLFEIFIVVPYKISLYPKWKIIPWSPIVYILAFTLIYVYHEYLEKRITNSK